jgi:diguanylate cyclase (GGDEF)-like protein
VRRVLPRAIAGAVPRRYQHVGPAGERPAEEEIAALRERSLGAGSGPEADRCLADIDAVLLVASEPAQRADLLLSRVFVLSDQWRTREALAGALEAMELFEEAGDGLSTLDAASIAAAMASRLGELSLASDLAVKSLVGLEHFGDDAVVASVAPRIGVFCYSFLDYERALEQFQHALAATERSSGSWRTPYQLYNLADSMLMLCRHPTGDGAPAGGSARDGLLASADLAVRRLADEGGAVGRQLGVARLQADLLLERGRAEEALEVLRSEAAGTNDVAWAAGQSASAVSEARALRLLGRPGEAVVAAARAVELADPSDDRAEALLVMDELVAAEQDAGDISSALDHALELKRRMWGIYRAQTAQLVEQAFARAAIETDRRALEAKTVAALRSAEEDALTRVGNRRSLERYLNDKARGGGRLALLIADIDHFKLVNDTFGHDVGDHVLRAVGQILKAGAHPGQMVARYGGEEFVFAVPSVDASQARAIAERARAQVAAHHWEELRAGLAVTMSIGVACGYAAGPRELLKAADRALYRAKRRGRDRVEVA